MLDRLCPFSTLEKGFNAPLNKWNNIYNEDLLFKSDFKDFGTFCAKHSFKSLPTEPKIISLYLILYHYLGNYMMIGMQVYLLFHGILGI